MITATTAHPATRSLLDEIVRINPLQSSFIEGSLDDVSDEELDDLERYLEFCAQRSLDIDYLAKCYDVIVKDTLREQLYFQRHKRYRYSSFDEVAQSVYFDDDYMSKYMHGLAITAWLWPNHRDMHRFFARTVPREQSGHYLEIGPGHGVYMLTAMMLSDYDTFEGVDLSPTSVAMTKSLLQSRDESRDKDYDIHRCDFLVDKLHRDAYDAIVMGEVLEHVEEPQLFLEKIREIAYDDAFIFITTPINAPAIDHIYLFESYDDIEKLVARAGLYVVDAQLIPYPGQSLDESLQQALPVNVCLVLGV